MNSIYNPQSRSQQAAAGADLGNQGQDRRFFIFIATQAVSVVLPSASPAVALASQSTSGALMSPAKQPVDVVE